MHWFSRFDSSVIGNVVFHAKFTGNHTMDLHPLAGLASTTLQLETSSKSSAAEGRTGKEREGTGSKREQEKGGNYFSH